jgi:hypothetical protein
VSTGNAAGRVDRFNPADRVEVVGFVFFVGIQKRRERCQICERITIGQILVIGPDAREIIGGQELGADRGVHAETIAGDHLAVNGSAGDRCVLGHKEKFLFFALASIVPTGPSRFGRAGTLCASTVFLSTQTPTTKGHGKDS